MVHSEFDSQISRGKYDDTKMLFFAVLALSAIFDTPFFIGCIYENGPTDCEWDNESFTVCWALHILALCGYAFCVGIPSVLWSDIIADKDGLLFFSKQRHTFIKTFFLCSIGCYVLLQVAGVIAILITFHSNDSSSLNNNTFYGVSSIAEPIIMSMISGGCLWSGFRLQRYVYRAQLKSEKLLKLLFHLNFIMFLITFTYLFRAFLVITLFLDVRSVHTFCLLIFKNEKLIGKWKRIASVSVRPVAALHEDPSSHFLFILFGL